MEAKEILALDVGASNVARLAEPFMSISTSDAIKTVNKYLKEHEVEAVVVGLPRSLSGEDTDQTRWIRGWTDKAKAKIATPIYYQDEALTTKQANSSRLTANSSLNEHALASAIILQDFLDSPETDRVLA
jgi:putative Holliday junction resolvase